MMINYVGCKGKVNFIDFYINMYIRGDSYVIM